jgi:iron complex outermembrane receptor protein
MSRADNATMHGVSNSRRRATLLLSVVLATCSAIAQDSPDEDLTSLGIVELTHLKVLSASRYLEDPKKAPAAVTVISSEEITQYGWRTLAEALRSIRGIYTAYDRNYTFVGVNGFLQSGDYNARVLLLVNGHRTNENVYDGAMIGTEFPLDIDLIDRIEVVRGSNSSLYGTNAELLIVNVITRNPDGSGTLEAAGDTRSFLGRTGRVTADIRLGTANGLFSGSLYRSNGASRVYFPEFASSENNNGFAENLDGDRSTQIFGDLHRGALRVQGLWASRLKIVPTASYETNFNDPDNRTIDTRAFVDARYGHSFGDRTEMQIRAYYDAYRFRGSYPYGGTKSPDRYVEINDATADWIGLEATLAHKIGPDRLVVGASGEYNLRIDQRNYDVGSAPTLNDHRAPWLVSAFGEAEINLTPKFTVNAGGRIDHYNQFDTAVSPRIALMFFPASRTSLKYIFGHAFRVPDPYDQYYVDQADIAAPNLTPETVDSHTLVFTHNFAPWLGVTAEGFSNRLNDVIESEYDAESGQSQFVNGKGDRGRGVGLEFDAKRVSGWGARSSYTFVATKDGVNGETVQNSPSQLAKLNATAPLSRYGGLGLEILYTGAQNNYRGDRISSSLLTNLTLSSRPVFRDWQFSASCYNVFDRNWSTPTGPELTQAAVPQDGRTFRFKVSYRLKLRSEKGSK